MIPRGGVHDLGLAEPGHGFFQRLQARLPGRRSEDDKPTFRQSRSWVYFFGAEDGSGPRLCENSRRSACSAKNRL